MKQFPLQSHLLPQRWHLCLLLVNWHLCLLLQLETANLLPSPPQTLLVQPASQSVAKQQTLVHLKICILLPILTPTPLQCTFRRALYWWCGHINGSWHHQSGLQTSVARGTSEPSFDYLNLTLLLLIEGCYKMGKG